MCTFFNIFGLKISSYGVCMLIGLYLTCFLAITRAGKRGVSKVDMLGVLASIFGIVIFGAGFLYVLVTYTPAQIWDYIKRLDFSFADGLVFYGGLISGILGTPFFCKLFKVNFCDLEASVVPYIPLGHAVGRVGCLLAGCCYGREYDGPFAVHNYLLSMDKTYFPVQGLESLFLLGIMCVLLFYAQKERKNFNIMALYLILYAIARFLLELFRGDAVRGAFWGLSTSQWISIGMFTVGGLIQLYNRRKTVEEA
ncbi:MAG: prolipoprotein diacylglyceryl transferase [Ruminococcaceae bacterium]|nr:prolipoprotein diacylglyceryl transferase [Oscillospiraceae bacterium]